MRRRILHQQDIYIIHREDEEQTVVVHVEVTSWPRPAKFSGPPEDCYPAEPIEWDYTTTPDSYELTDDEYRSVEEQIEFDEE